MHKTGRAFFAEEANLNLMTGQELRDAAVSMAKHGFHIIVENEKLAGWPSNLLLIGTKRGAKFTHP